MAVCSIPIHDMVAHYVEADLSYIVKSFVEKLYFCENSYSVFKFIVSVRLASIISDIHSF